MEREIHKNRQAEILPELLAIFARPGLIYAPRTGRQAQSGPKRFSFKRYLMKNRLADGSAGVKSIAVSYRKSDTNWKIVKAGDYNGDGKTDLLWQKGDTKRDKNAKTSQIKPKVHFL